MNRAVLAGAFVLLAVPLAACDRMGGGKGTQRSAAAEPFPQADRPVALDHRYHKRVRKILEVSKNLRAERLGRDRRGPFGQLFDRRHSDRYSLNWM